MGLNLPTSHIVYGMGSAGRQLIKLLDEAGQPIAACIDKNAAAIGSISGYPVQPPDALSCIDLPRDCTFIVAVNSRHAYESIRDSLVRRYPELPIPVWGRSIIDQLATTKCHQRLEDGLGLDLRDCMGCRADPSRCEAFRAGARALSAPQQTASTPISKLADFSYFITNHCTLNCLHCVEALPYYTQRTSERSERILGTIRKVVQASGFIDRFSITGGETLLNRELPEIIEGLLNTPGIGFIYLYTSGTVVPSPSLLSRLANPRIAVNLSDYGANISGKLAENFQRCQELFQEHGIAFRLLPNKLWFDLGAFEPLDLDEEALKISFANCAFTNCMTVSDGVLYRCPHQLAGIQLGKLPAPPGQTVDLDQLEGERLVSALDHFLNLDFIDACKHCKLSCGAQEVPAAIQVRRSKLPRSTNGITDGP